MKTLKIYKALVYEATYETFKNLENELNVNVLSDCVKNGIYYEVIISPKDLRQRIINTLDDLKNNFYDFEDKIENMLSQICRVIYNDRQNLLFLVTDDLNYWTEFSNYRQLIKHNLIDESVIKKITNKEFQNLVDLSINFIVDENEIFMQIKDISLGNRSLQDLKVGNNFTIEKYKRQFDDFIAEIKSPNIIIISESTSNFNLRKSLSKVIVRDYFNE